MTYIEAYRKGIKTLKQNNISDYNFDNRLIFENIFGINRVQLMINESQQVSEEKLNIYLKDIKRRSQNEPLQYILGSWEFMQQEFKVGEGVLIPREETEILVNKAIEILNQSDEKNPVVYDLCSGSGCIGISIARFVPNAKVYLIEKSEEALFYLKQNVKSSELSNIVIKKCDITISEDFKDLQECDLLVSNPPYIKTDDINTLQSEVRKEPKMALDGGNDGLFFYNSIYNGWIDKIKKSGFIIFEIGEKQAEQILEIYEPKCKLISKIKDFSNIYRTLVFKKY